MKRLVKVRTCRLASLLTLPLLFSACSVSPTGDTASDHNAQSTDPSPILSVNVNHEAWVWVLRPCANGAHGLDQQRAQATENYCTRDGLGNGFRMQPVWTHQPQVDSKVGIYGASFVEGVSCEAPYEFPSYELPNGAMQQSTWPRHPCTELGWVQTSFWGQYMMIEDLLDATVVGQDTAQRDPGTGLPNWLEALRSPAELSTCNASEKVAFFNSEPDTIAVYTLSSYGELREQKPGLLKSVTVESSIEPGAQRSNLFRPQRIYSIFYECWADSCGSSTQDWNTWVSRSRSIELIRGSYVSAIDQQASLPWLSPVLESPPSNGFNITINYDKDDSDFFDENKHPGRKTILEAAAAR
ncbi:MAG: hypothetical protein IPJ88_17775 [Myxococcales bacterium]|nr:MAG: hypothetical protein IPJ88_17775 [Myxococcales bacterium]